MNDQQRTAGLVKMIVRGLLRRCAHCGGKDAFFTGWSARQDRCATCGLKWERSTEGFLVGALAMNILLTVGSLMVVMVIGVVSTYPQVPAWQLSAVVGSVALIVGIGGFPISYTVWLAVDLRMNPLSEEELADAAAHAR